MGTLMFFKFLTKWALNGIVVTLMLMYFADVSFWSAFIAASILTVIAYVIGDQVILRSTTNTNASIADGLLALIGVCRLLN